MLRVRLPHLSTWNARRREVVARYTEALAGRGGRRMVHGDATGSTAYAFSAGGPVVWPDVEALLLVPTNAHALFARPMVVSPTSVIDIDVLDHTGAQGVLWCDGRRTVDLAPGARVEVRRGHVPIHLARLNDAPFTDRLVAKFDLPVSGWRGAAERRRRI